VADRIDLLAIDENGHSVVIELKRGEHKLQLLQALSYASMIADWEHDQFKNLLTNEQRSRFEEFTSDNSIEEVINEHQRILLIAENYDYTILSTAKWLTDFYGMNITCYQISLARDSVSQSEYLAAIQLFPPNQLADQARRRGALRSEEANKFPTIEQLLKKCTNPEVMAYFQACLALPGLRRNRRADSVVYPPNGKMRFRVQPRRTSARVHQLGRFDGDQAFWTTNLSFADVRDRGHDLRFYLSTEADISFFKNFAEHELSKRSWSKSYAGEEDETTIED
jgi:hypothetical protein